MRWGIILAELILGLPLISEASPINNNGHSNGPTVDLGYAQYEGTALDIGVNQFLGIRYAAPPLGHLRFRAAEDPLVTHGLQPAKEVSTLLYCLIRLFNISEPDLHLVRGHLHRHIW